jgi:hypothetical protein
MKTRGSRAWWSSWPIRAVLLLGGLTAVHCASGSGSITSDPAVAADLRSVVETAVRRSDVEGAKRFLEVETRWSTQLAPVDYGQLANDLLDVDRPVTARAVLDSASRRFGSDPETAARIGRLRERARLAEIRLELSSPVIRD